ncbi:glycosyltransferase family 2 protein [Sagittula sp. S175]|uniref:glycosyltransferase family 2 protein n=1 Tax=Sagittula sp. S175 TaxID=3415129 RepID=UPI003C7BA77F
MTAPARTALVACMKDEGIFVLEWLAYHAGLGFDRIVVATNGCTDGSDALLAHLAARGILHHIDHDPQGRPPQDAAMDRVLEWARDTLITHLLHIDSDEFLVLLDGTLHDLLERTQKADVVPLPWRLFGDSGVMDWTPGDLVLDRNTMAEEAPAPGEAKFKCLFKLASFARATDHNPLDPQVADPVVLTPDGDPLSNASLYQKKSSRFRPHDVAARARSAQVYHYAVRSEDVFLMKNDRGDGQGKEGDTKYHLNSHWHRMANRNDTHAPQMRAHLARVNAQLAEWRADPETRRLERACQDWFETRRDAVLTDENRRAWTRKAMA